MDEILEQEKIKMTPESGFNLVAIDYFSADTKQLYLIKHYDMYQDALNGKKSRKNQNEYFVLYRNSSGECQSR